MAGQSNGLEATLDFPLMQAVFGRRSRRFGLGMEIPSGPLAFRSDADPVPLSELEGVPIRPTPFGVEPRRP